MQTKPVKIAVIIPVYNLEAYITEAVESVLKQPYQDIQIVCVNDGSTDQSLPILCALKTNNPRVHIISQANAGVSVARNRGMEYVFEHLSADYIMFLDGDDIWYKNWLNEDVIALFGEGHDTVMFDSCFATHTLAYRSPSQHRYTGIVNGGDFAVNADHQPFCAAAYRREFLQRFGIRFHEGQKTAEDIHFKLEARSLSKTCCFCERLIYVYRTRPGSAVRRSIPAIEFYTPLFDGWIKSHHFLEERGFVSGCTYGGIKYYIGDLVNAHFQEFGDREALVPVLEKYASCLDVDEPNNKKAQAFLERYTKGYEFKQHVIGLRNILACLLKRIPFVRSLKEKRFYTIPLEY